VLGANYGHGEFGVVAGDGGGVMAGVPPGSPLGLAPSTIGFGEDAQVGTEVTSKSGCSPCRILGQGAGRAGGREG
jgi:hypothetical protein